MLQANKHISLVCGEPGSLSTFNIILLSERGFHCLLSITLLSFDQTILVRHESVSRPQISVFGVISGPWVSVCWVQAVASSVYTDHSSGLSYRNCKELSFSQSWVTLAVSHVTWCQVTRDMLLRSPGLRCHTLHCTDHYNVLAWVSPRDWRRWELSGGQGECTLVHTAALYCPLYKVNGKFYYFSNTSLVNLYIHITNSAYTC